MARKKLLLSFLVIGCFGVLLTVTAQNQKKPDPAGKKMIAAADNFLETLSEEQKEQATFAYDSDERVNWHFIPRERKGLPLKDLEGDARKAAEQLLQAGLSEAGYDQAVNVMSLEEILFLLEGGEREYRRDRRDPQKYYFSVFGEPNAQGTWGWRVEGHHLSLNYTIENGHVVASTPEFFGANPALVDSGPKRKIRVLGPEEDLARQLLNATDPEEMKTIWISKEAPDDIRGGGEVQPVVTEAVGLAAGDMNDQQKKLLRALLAEYLKNMPGDVEADRRKRINDAGWEGIHFAWWGSDKPNERHHYVVQGDTFIIEYNNTQNDANHLHTIWRNIDGDFNLPRE
ncbi:DUF3500 domain-containing protein [Thalassoroseus pseudoceratinae]|uniref:DUF3500 domain-containing protein n=1 Tax=Thalassoroseus pseudoceratinae TaxID=2713176 RepID=UPI00142041F4|nr:DUF3500 domain-containing protein [Thalassoroseus pseudoceratinae]